MATNTVGGGIDQTAIIGHAPESRDWTPDKPTWQPIVHPTARIEAYVTVDAGTYRSTTIGPGAWLMKHAHAGHDVMIGRDVELSPGVIVGGSAIIGDRTRIGMGAIIGPYVKIGQDCKIAMGSVVHRDVPDGTFVGGNPARRLPWPNQRIDECGNCGNSVVLHAQGLAMMDGQRCSEWVAKPVDGPAKL